MMAYTVTLTSEQRTEALTALYSHQLSIERVMTGRPPELREQLERYLAATKEAYAALEDAKEVRS